MTARKTGEYVTISTVGKTVNTFVPNALSPAPPLEDRYGTVGGFGPSTFGAEPAGWHGFAALYRRHAKANCG